MKNDYPWMKIERVAWLIERCYRTFKDNFKTLQMIKHFISRIVFRIGNEWYELLIMSFGHIDISIAVVSLMDNTLR